MNRNALIQKSRHTTSRHKRTRVVMTDDKDAMLGTMGRDTNQSALQLPQHYCSASEGQFASRLKFPFHSFARSVDTRREVHVLSQLANAANNKGVYDESLWPVHKVPLEMASFGAHSAASPTFNQVLDQEILRRMHSDAARHRAQLVYPQLVGTSMMGGEALALHKSLLQARISHENMTIVSRHRRMTLLESERELLRMRTQQIRGARESLQQANCDQSPSACSGAHPLQPSRSQYNTEMPTSPFANQKLTSKDMLRNHATSNKKSKHATLGRKWKAQYDTLAQHQARYKGTIPRVLLAGTRLGTWINEQRKQYKCFQKGMDTPLTQARIDVLDQIGFVWNAQEAAWQRNFHELVSIHERYGTWIVPPDHPANRKLCLWVKEQRRHGKLLMQGMPSHMTAERAQQLEKVGFCFDPTGDNACRKHGNKGK